ncbi:MAG: tetratricopeptide repeat protein [Ignavibacteriales bacterium]|nr:tetratricopeptide repeat protein [Ignavibacteriales bacterium]
MIGSSISHYKILEKLGEGGMGVVYRAHDERLDRDVAIKFLSQSLVPSPAEQERFVREARAASSLNHPSICTIHDIGRHEGQWYFVMEFLGGTTFKDLAGRNDEQTCLRLIDQAAEGLAAAHEKNIVHRDIKSSNIMLTSENRVKIMDFGLAKIAGKADLTQRGSTVGTMAYLPPEQARGEEVDHRADIYALGVVLYELLTGERPFQAPYEHALLYQILNEPPRAPSSKVPAISPSTDAIVRRCLEKKAVDRYQSIADFRTDLRSALHGSPLGKHTPRTRNRRRRRLIIAALVLLPVIALFAVGLRSTWQTLEGILGLSGVPDRQHLAVLPFQNIGNNSQRQALCDGLTETMTSKLTQLEQFHGSLWVVPASEVRRVNTTSPEEARKAFGVNLVLDGSLQTIGELYRMTLNLVDATTLRLLNSAMIDVSHGNLTKLHDESVIRVLEMLHIEFHPEMRNVLQSGGTTVPSAYEYYLRGRGALLRYEQEENIDEAILSFRKALREDSTYALAHAALAEAFWRKYESGKEIRWAREALGECEKAKALDATHAPVNVMLGIVYTGTGKPAAAIPLFEAALATDPANAEAYRGLAKAYEALGDLGKAEQTYRRAVELRPDYWGSHNDLGVFYSRNNRYTEAIVSFKKVTEQTPDNYRGFNNLGGMYYYLNQWADARAMFERSYAIRPTHRTASNIGTLNYIEGRYQDAARWYEKALQLNSNDHVVAGNLASAYFWAGEDRTKAIETFQQAILLARKQLDVNPKDAETHALLGGYYAMVGDTAGAIFHSERSLNLNPQDASIMFRAGTTHEQIGDRDRALKWIQKSIESGYSLSEISNQPELKNLYADPRFEAMLATRKKKDQPQEH